jgi:glycerophosphoryl diester phosphodiesterase
MKHTNKKVILEDLDAKPMVVAHRGFSGKAPENTIPAFRMALEAGVSMIELDVQITKDGAVAVIHDATVDRTTDGTGRVADLTLAELRHLDAGSWFSADFKGERIPSLEEALELIAPRALVNIELKSPRIIRNADTKSVHATLEIVRKMELLDRVLFSSFNHKLMKYLKTIEPGSHTGVIFHPVLHFGKLPSVLATPANAEVFVCGLREATKRRIADAAKHNIIVGVYGVDTDEAIDRMLDMGVRVLVSDNPDYILNGLHRNSRHDTK